MPITINSNIPSINAQRNLGKATLALNDSYARLSSGLRINKASDDAAGLSIADYLRTDKRVAAVAIRNANDGISALNIADGALNEISSLLARMAELAEQSGNGILGVNQRVALSKEFEQLADEIDRIAAVTEFNGKNLLTAGSITLQVGLRGNRDLGYSQLTLKLYDMSSRMDITPTGPAQATMYDPVPAGTGTPPVIVDTTDNPANMFDLGNQFGGGSTVPGIHTAYSQGTLRNVINALITANGGTPGTDRGLTLATEETSRIALDAVKIAVDTVSAVRGDLGAVQSRLATTVSNLGVTRENFSAAESQIRDVDVATEAAEMTRLTILQQAGASILSQANQQPGIALKLLG